MKITDIDKSLSKQEKRKQVNQIINLNLVEVQPDNLDDILGGEQFGKEYDRMINHFYTYCIKGDRLRATAALHWLEVCCICAYAGYPGMQTSKFEAYSKDFGRYFNEQYDWQYVGKINLDGLKKELRLKP